MSTYFQCRLLHICLVSILCVLSNQWWLNIILSAYGIYFIYYNRDRVRCWTYRLLMIIIWACLICYGCETIRRWAFGFLAVRLWASRFMTHVSPTSLLMHANEIWGLYIIYILLYSQEPRIGVVNGDVHSEFSTLDFNQG